MNDRQAALDEFASQNVTEGQLLMPTTITHAPPPALVHGAQAVVVPRDEAKVLNRIRILANAAGEAWYYRIPFKDHKTNKTTYVEGPSIKLANDVARIYGSCDVDEWVSGEGLDYWEFTARFIDLESGYALTRVFRQRKDAASVGKNSSRNAEIGFAIGASKAIRNVVVNALQTFSDYAFEEARNALVNQVGRDIERWRKEVSARISQMVDIKRVEAVIGRQVSEWLAPDIASVAAMGKAIKDGMASIDDTFPHIERQEHDTTKGQLDKVSGNGEQPSPGKEGAAVDATDAPSTPGPEDDAPSDSRTTDADATSSPSGPDQTRTYSPELRKEAEDKLLKVAANAKLEKDARLYALEDAAPLWEEKLEPRYFEALMKTCIQVAKGFMTEKDARKTLATIK